MPEGCCVKVGAGSSTKVLPTPRGEDFTHVDSRFMVHSNKFLFQGSPSSETGTEAVVRAVQKLDEKFSKTQLEMGNRLEERLKTVESKLLQIIEHCSLTAVSDHCSMTSAKPTTACDVTSQESGDWITTIPVPAQVPAHQGLLHQCTAQVNEMEEHPKQKAIARRASLRASRSFAREDGEEGRDTSIVHARTAKKHGPMEGLSFGPVKSLMASRHYFEKLPPWRKAIHHFVSHNRFDVVIAGVVAYNSILLGLQVDYEARHAKEFDFYNYMEYVCTFVYTAELVLRVIDQGSRWWSGKQRWWMVFDALLVAVSWFELIVDVVFKKMIDLKGSSSVPKLLKIFRLARILRVVRMVRFLQPLRIMTGLILGSMMQLLWLFILLLGVIYVFAVVLTQGASDYRFLRSPQVVSKVEKDFGTLPKSLYTLFLSMTGGVSWGEPAAHTQDIGHVYFAVFVFFVFFTFFSVLNIVTGLFVDGAIQQANDDRSTMIEKAVEMRQQCGKALAELLQEIDVDNSGYISREEWDLALADRNIMAMMNGLEIDPKQTDNLFALLDDNNDQIVGIEEFVAGMMRLKGIAKAIDIHLLMSKVSDVNQQVKALCHYLNPSQFRSSKVSLLGSERTAIRLQTQLQVSPPIP